MESMTWEVITPELAKEYLKFNMPNNRRISKVRVTMYAKEMTNNRWDIESTQNIITFNETGELIDGQHRLSAVVKAGIPVKMRVMRGNKGKVFDRGNSRSIYDQMVCDGFNVTKGVVSLSKAVLETIMDERSVNDSEIVDLIVLDADLLRNSERISKIGATGAICNKAGVQAGIYATLKLGVREEMLEEMFYQVNSLIPKNEDSVAAFVLNKTLRKIMEGKHDRVRGETYKVRCFNVTTQAIRDYYNGVKRKIAYDDTRCCYKDEVKEMLAVDLGKLVET